MSKHENNKEMAIVDQIELLYGELNKQMILSEETLQPSVGIHTLEDFNSLKKSLKKVRMLLHRLYRCLEQSNDGQADAISKIRHDLRNVLSAVIGFSELIMEETKESLTKSVIHASFTQVTRFSQQLLELLDQVMRQETRNIPDSTLSAQLEETQHLFVAAIESIEEGMAIFDKNDQLTHCNQQFRNFYPSVESLGYIGFTFEEFLRENWRLETYQEERRKSLHNLHPTSHKEDQEKWITRHLSYHQNPQQPYQILLKSGQWVEIIERRISGGGLVSVHRDISQEKMREKQLQYLAHHDPLTGLVNRNFFERQLHDVLMQHQLSKSKFAIVVLNIDDFKAINDTYGHDFGDYILSSAAQKFKTTMRGNDMVGRIGDDEFAAVLEDATDIEKVKEIAQRCIDNVNMTIERDGQSMTISISMGIALFPDHGNDIKELFRKAEEAIAIVKKEGKGHYRFAKAG